MSSDKKLEEKVVAQVAETTISQQLDAAKNVDVDIQTDLFKILQGQADAVSFEGQGLVIKDIRVEDIKVQTDKVEINPLSAVFGQVELNKPVNTKVRVVLTEADINRALTSKYIRSKWQKFDLNVDGEIISLKPQTIQIRFPDEGKIECVGKVTLEKQKNTSNLGFIAVIRPRTQLQPIMLESFVCSEGEGISFDIVVAIIKKVEELVNLAYFELDDIALRIQEMAVHKGSMMLITQAYIRQIPAEIM
jgi:LmeA-like phospholipid-binding